jgi:hypothetical protein
MLFVKIKKNVDPGKNNNCPEKIKVVRKKKSCCQENVDRKMLFEKKMISGKRRGRREKKQNVPP